VYDVFFRHSALTEFDENGKPFIGEVVTVDA